MEFYEVTPALNEGKKIKLSSWKNAYWYRNEEGRLINHSEDGREFRTYDMFPSDLAMVLMGDWEVVEDTPEVKYFSFGEALHWLKEGEKVARKGWNGKDMFLVLCPGNKVPAEHMRVKSVKKFYKQADHSQVTIAPHIDLKAADGTYVTGWLASQTDLLADDWYIV